MIIATLATYPPREKDLATIIRCVAPQVDVLNIVLNEFGKVPDVCKTADNVNAIIPREDTKDTGKFLPTVAPDDWLFTIDDDIIYPDDYVSRSIAELTALNKPQSIGGYHSSIYTRHPRLQSRLIRRILNRNPNFIIGQRRINGFSFALSAPIYVDQLGTGAALMRGADAPPFEAVKHAQKYVDIAAAQYWYESGRRLISLARTENWIHGIEPEGETIIDGFTSRMPTVLADTIYKFAYKRPYVGQEVKADDP